MRIKMKSDFYKLENMEFGEVYMMAHRGVTNSEYFLFTRGKNIKVFGEGYTYKISKKELKVSLREKDFLWIGKLKNKGGLNFG